MPLAEDFEEDSSAKTEFRSQGMIGVGMARGLIQMQCHFFLIGYGRAI
jgi:hypothetical protein